MNKFSTLVLLLAAMFAVPVTSHAQVPVKKVLLEEFTTCMCGMCPPQSHAIKDWYENHESNAILMVHHAGFGTDSMTNSVATTTCNYFDPSSFGFAPAIMIDRDVYPWVDSVAYMSVNGFDTIADRVSQDPAVVGVTITGTYNSSTRALSVTGTATFIQAMPTYAYRMMFYLVEDSIIGSGSGWDQKCYSSQFANQYYPGQWNSSTQYISAYPHRYVQRAALGGGLWGTASTIPNTPAANTPYTQTVTYTVPSNMDDQRLKIVVVIAEYGPDKLTRQVLNANDAWIDASFSATPTYIDENALTSMSTFVYPNPSNGTINVRYELTESNVTDILVLNLCGEVVMTFDSRGVRVPGRYDEQLDISALPAGAYLLSIVSGNQRSVQKILKQ